LELAALTARQKIPFAATEKHWSRTIPHFTVQNFAIVHWRATCAGTTTAQSSPTRPPLNGGSQQTVPKPSAKKYTTSIAAKNQSPS
jgi:hypothetical protein